MLLGREKVEAPEYLSGWKDIAQHMGKGVRTVQRYERQFGLPVRRPSGKESGSVIATKAELEAWVAAAPIRSPRLLGPDDGASEASLRLGITAIRNSVAEMRQLRAEMNALRADLRSSLRQLKKSIEGICQGIDSKAPQSGRDSKLARTDSAETRKFKVLSFDTSEKRAS